VNGAPAAQLRDARISVAGVSSPVVEAGPAEPREAVVFVHGNPGSRTDWLGLVGAAGGVGRALALDMPGFGQADKPRDFPYRVSAYADFLQGALEQLGVARVHLVVHDFGGPFGLLWGLQHPDSWASVALIDVGILPGYRWHAMARRWRTPLLGELVQAWIPRWAWRRAMQRNNPKGLPSQFVDKMYDDYDRATRRAVLALYRATPDPGESAAEVALALAKLHKPALVVWGAKDPFAGAHFAQRQREFFDVRDVVVLPDSGHWPFQDDPAAVEHALVEFLRTQLAPAPA
jgi:pimeloyl-ACP methyl ester carboxylesterase